MATSLKGINHQNSAKVDISKKSFGLVVAAWNGTITEALYSAAYETLLQNGATEKNIIQKKVPGSFELSLGAQWMAQEKSVDAVICLGCVIQGETRHFDFICKAVADGLTSVSLKYDKPVIFGVLTPDTYKQAEDRAGGKLGNKGEEAALSAIQMLGFNN
ncbi:MAG: 6,7-dimethyl-8-ribityllumazine synthase [Cyclobacteriaceae bacterium]